MPLVAIRVAASPSAAFFSQIASLRRSLLALTWSRWEPVVQVYLGGPRGAGDGGLDRWQPHLDGVELTWAGAGDGFWPQSDAVFSAPVGRADAVLAMDADTFAVAGLEAVLDGVVADRAVAGVIAHYPLPGPRGSRPSENWAAAAEAAGQEVPAFEFEHTLVPPDAPDWKRRAPFYLNFGVVFFPGAGFAELGRRYLALRPRLAPSLAVPDFSGQAALTFAVGAGPFTARPLPLRFNFPNDPAAEVLAPEEAAEVAVFHYLRTAEYDRHEIFTSAPAYERFLELELSGVHAAFQRAVERTLGAAYPFR